VLLKAARKVLELKAARMQATAPNADAVEGLDFFKVSGGRAVNAGAAMCPTQFELAFLG
jgi:hypothetical protein